MTPSMSSMPASATYLAPSPLVRKKTSCPKRCRWSATARHREMVPSAGPRVINGRKRTRIFLSGSFMEQLLGIGRASEISFIRERHQDLGRQPSR